MANHPEIDTAWVTLNRACNFRCRWCYAASTGYNANDDMPLGLFRQIIDLVSGLGIRNVTLTGGEPTIYPHILEAIRYCKGRGLNVTIPTNGLVFALRDRLEQFYKAGVDRVGVSVKGHDRQSYLDATGVDCFDSVVKAISNLSRQKDMQLVVLTVVTPDNKSHVADVLRMAKGAGASVFALLPYRNFGCLDGSSEPYCQRDIQKYVVDLAEYLASHFAELNDIAGGMLQLEQTLPLCLWDPAFSDTLIERNWLSVPCQLHRHDGLIFDTEGCVIPCNAMPSIQMGRIHEDFCDVESFWKFWASGKVEDVFLKYRSAPDARCMSCDKRSRCRGGCVSNWLNYSFDDIRGYLREA